MEHSAVLLTCIKIPNGFLFFVLSIFEWSLKTGFTVYVRYDCRHHLIGHVQLSSRTRGLNFGWNLHLHIYLVCKNSEGSWESAWMQRLI